MDILETIAKNITQRRSELGLTQEDVAKKLNMARQNYRVYESGNREIKITRLARIAKALEIDIIELLRHQL